MTIAIQTCLSCFSADDVKMNRLPDGLVRYTCTNAKRHDDGHEFIWERTVEQAAGAADTAGAGVTDELLDPMLRCVVDGEPFVEYGSSNIGCPRAAPTCTSRTSGSAGT